jgi:hypothetical protein
LLSNCCAVLLNISPHVCGLHSYAAMRLASVAVSCMKRYLVECGKNGGRPAEEGDLDRQRWQLARSNVGPIDDALLISFIFAKATSHSQVGLHPYMYSIHYK